MKLALGTVQFGEDYGVSNRAGRVKEGQVRHILEFAREVGIDTLDTASSYGISELALGIAGVGDWKVITKLYSPAQQRINIEEFFYHQIEQSLERLQIDKLHGLLLHNPTELAGFYNDQLPTICEKIKKCGLVEKIGVSIYEPAQLGELFNIYDFDIVQAPINIFDRSLEMSGWAARLKQRSTEVHARSVFLQGLLLMPLSEHPKKFSNWIPDFERYFNWLHENNLSPLAATVNFVHDLEFVDRMIIGVQNKKQLSDIVLNLMPLPVDVPDLYLSRDRRLINPSRWSEL